VRDFEIGSSQVTVKAQKVVMIECLVNGAELHVHLYCSAAPCLWGPAVYTGCA
jgi:hypothetical protein